MKLTHLKDSSPIEVVEYDVANRIVEEPAFKWWVPHTIRKRNRIISKVKSWYWQTTHKFGSRLPKRTEEALHIDKITGTDFWRKAINKEMSNINIAWKVDDEHTPNEARAATATVFVGFQEIGCHLIFYAKMDFTQKARFVSGGHTTEAQSSIMYSSVVSRVSVRLANTIAALNGVEIMSCDLENAYINAMCCNNIWFEGGTECGEDKVKLLIVVRALYGLKSAGSSWHASLAQVLKDLDFVSMLADLDVWIREAVRGDGFKYYEMLFVYVDYILAVLHKSIYFIKEIAAFYRAK